MALIRRWRENQIDDVDDRDWWESKYNGVGTKAYTCRAVKWGRVRLASDIYLPHYFGTGANHVT